MAEEAHHGNGAFQSIDHITLPLASCKNIPISTKQKIQSIECTKLEDPEEEQPQEPPENGSPALLHDETSSSSSEEESWSESQDIRKIQNKVKIKKKRVSVAVKNNTLVKREPVTRKRACSGKQPRNPMEVSQKLSSESGNPSKSVKTNDYQPSSLSTAVGLLQEKIIHMADEYENQKKQLLEELQNRKHEHEKLVKELSSQKHCIDLLLAESSKKNNKKDPDNNKGVTTKICGQLHDKIELIKADVAKFKAHITQRLDLLESENVKKFQEYSAKAITGKDLDCLREDLGTRSSSLQTRVDQLATKCHNAEQENTLALSKLAEETKLVRLRQDLILEKSSNNENNVSYSKPNPGDKTISFNINLRVNPPKTDQTNTITEGSLEGSNKTSISISKPMDPEGPTISVTKSSSGATKDTRHSPELPYREAGASEISTSSNSADPTPELTSDGNVVSSERDTESEKPTETKFTSIRKTTKSSNHSKSATHTSSQQSVQSDQTENRNPSNGSTRVQRDTYRVTRDTQQHKHRVTPDNKSDKKADFIVKPVGTQQKEGKTYSRKKCLLIHDSTFENFDQDKFPKQFEVTCFQAKKACIAAKSKKLKDLIKGEQPECIYVHLGLHDIISGSVDSTLCSFEALRDYLTSFTNANVCFSLIVPTANDSLLNRKISEFNKELNLMVTTARSDNETLKDQLFTYNNSSVAWLNQKQTDGVHLTDRGKLVMWTKLKDGLRKTMRLPRPYLQSGKRPTPTLKNSENNG